MFIADVAKGVAAVHAQALVNRVGGVEGPAAGGAWACALGLAAVLGHTYTVFLKFRGGKGVATSLGVLLALAPLASLVALGTFGAVFAATRMVSAGSLAAALALPAVLVARDLHQGGGPAAVTVLALLLAVLVWARHIPNLRRIAAGTEHRFGGPGGRA